MCLQLIDQRKDVTQMHQNVGIFRISAPETRKRHSQVGYSKAHVSGATTGKAQIFGSFFPPPFSHTTLSPSSLQRRPGMELVYISRARPLLPVLAAEERKESKEEEGEKRRSLFSSERFSRRLKKTGGGLAGKPNELH